MELPIPYCLEKKCSQAQRPFAGEYGELECAREGDQKPEQEFKERGYTVRSGKLEMIRGSQRVQEAKGQDVAVKVREDQGTGAKVLTLVMRMKETVCRHHRGETSWIYQ